MSLGRQLLARWFGIGATDLTFMLREKTHPRGSQVHATLLVEGGAVEQRIVDLSATVEEFWPRYESRTYCAMALATNLTVEPGSRQAFPISFTLPDDARLSRESSYGLSIAGYRIIVLARTGAWSLDRRAIATLSVRVHSELVAVHEALRRLGFEKRPWLHPDHTRNDGAQPRAGIKPVAQGSGARPAPAALIPALCTIGGTKGSSFFCCVRGFLEPAT